MREGDLRKIGGCIGDISVTLGSFPLNVKFDKWFVVISDTSS